MMLDGEIRQIALLCPWVILLMDGFEMLFRDVGIDLGSGDVNVSQHFLNGTQVCAVFQKVSSK